MSELEDEKKFYERFYNLHNDPILLDIMKKYSIRVFRRSSVLEGFETFIKKTGFSGKTCIEIGSLKGLTSIVLSRYFDKVISIDIINDPEKYEIMKYLGITNIEFVNVKDNQEKYEIIQNNEFDGAYVDGNHHDDTQSDFMSVKKSGKVLFHEYWKTQSPVFNLVNKLKHEGDVKVFGKFALWTA